MSGLMRIGVAVGTVAVALFGLAGPASADDGGRSGDRNVVGASGVASGVRNKQADDSSNNCRDSVGLLTSRDCRNDGDRGHAPTHNTDTFDGVLTGILTSTAVDHSNNCGSLVAVLAETRCVIVEHSARPR
ncbi:hypothetical protein J7W19_00925 [Streptomyces mobaraensis NBRC 13819 = DSM 40847]|nr:hypothetical protein [Streptomyces mobaraensis]QTT72186.1 hypothetical protein J7W19_00925 [Streptomyces mobaraensis NBRC 13819 = DSM 40847]